MKDAEKVLSKEMDWNYWIEINLCYCQSRHEQKRREDEVSELS